MPAPCHHHKHFVGLNSSDLTTACDCTLIATVSQTVSQGTERASDCPRVTQLPRAEPETEVKRFQSSLLPPGWAVFCVAELGFERRVKQPRGGGCTGRAEYTESPRPPGYPASCPSNEGPLGTRSKAHRVSHCPAGAPQLACSLPKGP